VPATSGLDDRRAAAALVAIEIVCVLLLVFGNRLPAAALTGVSTAILAPANSILRWVESVATARSDATRLRGEVATLRMEQGRLAAHHTSEAFSQEFSCFHAGLSEAYFSSDEPFCRKLFRYSTSLYGRRVCQHRYMILIHL